LIGLPIGIWVLAVLRQRDIRAAFKHLRPARSRPVLRAVIVALIVLMVLGLAGVAVRQAWEDSLIPKQARLATIEQAYRPQLDKLAGFAYDYDHYAAHPPKDEETTRLFADPAIVEAQVMEHTFEKSGDGFEVKTEEKKNPPASFTARIFRDPSIGKPVVNLYVCGDWKRFEYRAIVVDRKGIERAYWIRFDPSKMDELGRAPAAVAAALEEYRRTLVGYDLNADSVLPRQKWTRYDASRLKMYPTQDAWPKVLGHVDTKPSKFSIVSSQSPFWASTICYSYAFMVPLDKSLVASYAPLTLLCLKGISPKGALVAKTYTSLVCLGPMEGRLSFDSYATALLKGDVSGQITSNSHFALVITGKFSGRMLANSYTMIYLMGGCEGSVELKHDAKVYFAGRTTQADLSRINGKGSVFLEDSDLPPGEHKIGDLAVTVASRADSSKRGQPTARP
jgi:hypothetical protein